MSSIENGEYKYRPYSQEQEVPKGMENFTTWFKPLPTKDGRYIIRPTDIDGYIQSNKHNSAVMIEFKPAHQTDVNFGQESVLKHFSTLRTPDGKQQYAVLIFDPTWDDRDGSKMLATQELRVWVFINGVKIVEIRRLRQIHDAFEVWWETGKFEL
jgi:hypothetical protein